MTEQEEETLDRELAVLTPAEMDQKATRDNRPQHKEYILAKARAERERQQRQRDEREEGLARSMKWATWAMAIAAGLSFIANVASIRLNPREGGDVDRMEQRLAVLEQRLSERPR